ncbi:unnamed protein product [Hermetia illucens]|nr:unnamed protein product [Hermetia illucens]
MIKVLFVLFFRKLAKAMKLEIVPKKARKLFFTLIIENMKIREKEHIYRPDMIDLLLKLKKNELHHEGEDGKAESDTPAKTSWSEGELIAQCYIFFQAGFETTSGTLRFVAYQLATNPDAQAKLLKEIDQTHEKLAGKPLSYDNLSSLKYLEMVILETLRLWPPLFVTERQCGEEFHYKDDDGLQFKVPKGAFIWIPIQPLHMDAKYFPEPEKFKPERFEDKNEINSTGAYMPFGIGPRSCIGNRFALMEMKIALYYLLLKFTFEVCPETQIPAKLKNSMAGWVLQKEIKLYLKPRSEKLKDDSGSQ